MHKNYFDSRIDQMRILTVTEEQLLCKRIKSGDKTAEFELIKSSLRTVRLIAKKYHRAGISIDDLIQEGNVGLILAAKKFNPDATNRFNTYAIFWIRQTIQRYYQERVRLIRLPVHLETKRNKISQYIEEYAVLYNRMPTYDNIAEGIGSTAAFVKQLLISSTAPLSFDSEGSGIDDELSLYDTTGDEKCHHEEQCCDKDERKVLHEVMKKCLTERECKVMKMRFGFYDKEYTLKEVGKKLEISHEACRQIQMVASEKIRRYYSKMEQNFA